MHVVFEKEKNDRYFCKGLKKKTQNFFSYNLSNNVPYFFLISAWSCPKKHVHKHTLLD